MKKIGYLLFYFFLFCIHSSYAQQNKSIIKELNTYRPQQGTIIIYQDDAVTKMLGQNIAVSSNSGNIQSQLSSDRSDDSGSREHTAKARGYRIQVYSGNDQRRSKNIATARRNEIKSTYPNMDVSVSYSSPVWRVRAGNFRSRADAEQALKEMKTRFPSFGREMHIVDDVITIYVN